MKFNTILKLAIGFALSIYLTISVVASPVVRQGGGANAAAIQAIVDQFRADLGGANNGVGGSFTTGRREINWDGVPDNASEPNNFPVDFFNVNSPRGVIFNSIEDATGAGLNQFAVSSTTASGVPVRFGNINANYTNNFTTFSAQRLFIARNTHILEVNFIIPGTNIPATVSGFGLVFTDVDSATGGNRSLIRVYDRNGRQLSAASAPVADNGLSFVGISFNAGERIARVVIESGNAALSSTNNDGVNGVDVVAMDDFIYGEPRASQYHPSDFDGDGTADRTMFRPSTGQWFVLQSGSNTLTGTTFGANGDVPIEGDFDGDSRSDFAIWRPSTGQWIFNNSSNNSNTFVQLGAVGDKPVPGDYDKDGKTDPAVWRASNTGWYYLESSNNYNTFNVIGYGVSGDIPVQGSSQ